MNFIKKTTLLLTIIFSHTIFLGSMDRRLFSDLFKNTSYEDKKNPTYKKFKALEMKQRCEDEIRTDIGNMYEKISELNPDTDKHKIKKLEKRIKKYEYIIAGDWGDILLGGIAGKHGKHIAIDPVGNDILEGTKKGTALLFVGSASESVSKIMEDYSKKGFNGIFGIIEKSLSFLNRLVLHKGKKPFSISEIDSWKKLVSNDLREIENIVKNAEKNSSRGRDEILRALSSNETEEDEQDNLNLWEDFVEDLVNTCEQLAQEIENRKAYYKKQTIGFNVYNTAERLKNKLLNIRKWLVSVQSAKDFSTISEIKLIIPAMRKSFDNYFDNLSSQIKGSNKSTKSNNYTSNRRMSHWDDDDDDRVYGIR